MKKLVVATLSFIILTLAACQARVPLVSGSGGLAPAVDVQVGAAAQATAPAPTPLPPTPLPLIAQAATAAAPKPAAGAPAPPAPDAAPTAAPTAVPAPIPAPTPTVSPLFPVGDELTIAALRKRPIEGGPITIEQQLDNGATYARYIASFRSEGLKVYGLLTVPFGNPPEGGFKAIVFNHGYIPPAQYVTTERYVAYVDALARAGFVVFKIDLRGHGNSEGEPSGSYFSPNYTIDALSALKSLQTLDYVDPDGIGMWGHSMAGNLVLRAMLVDPAIKAGVIWAGAVYSYDDFSQYSIQDSSYSPPTTPTASQLRSREIRETYGPPNTAVPYWQAVSLTEHIDLLQAPIQLHHALNDDVVDVRYSDDLATVLNVAGKPYEYYQYDGGGHNISSPYFNEAIQRTIEFFQAHL